MSYSRGSLTGSQGLSRPRYVYSYPAPPGGSGYTVTCIPLADFHRCGHIEHMPLLAGIHYFLVALFPVTPVGSRPATASPRSHRAGTSPCTRRVPSLLRARGKHAVAQGHPVSAGNVIRHDGASVHLLIHGTGLFVARNSGRPRLTGPDAQITGCLCLAAA